MTIIQQMEGISKRARAASEDATNTEISTYAPSSRRLALLIEYDGSNYAGWQRQANALTIQEVLESALSRLCNHQCSVVGSGRTDSGVHGRGQIAHTDIPAACKVSEGQFARAINAHLPKDIRIREARIVLPSFHARFNATRREYRYTVVQEYSVFRTRYAWHVHTPLCGKRLQAAAEVFKGIFDFTPFSKYNPDTENYVCNVAESSWSEVECGVWQFAIAADRFVYGMVRSIVGAMIASLRYAAGADELAHTLTQHLASGKRSLFAAPAPAHGLILWRVEYPDDPFAEVYARDSEKMTILG